MDEFSESLRSSSAVINDHQFLCEADFINRSILIDNKSTGEYMDLTPEQAAAVANELLKFASALGYSQSVPFIAEQIELSDPAAGDYGGIKKALRSVDSGRIVLLKAIVAKDTEDHHRALIFNNSGRGVQWVYLPDYIECEDLRDAE